MRRPDPRTRLHGLLGGADGRLGAGTGDASGCPAVDLPQRKTGKPSVQVHSVRYAQRPRQDGGTIRDVVIEIVQRRRGYLDPAIQDEVDGLETDLPLDPKDWDPRYRPDFTLRGGCSLLIDGESGLVRYVIAKDILSEERLVRRRKYESGDALPGFGITYDRLRARSRPRAVRDAPSGILNRVFLVVVLVLEGGN